MSKNPVLNTYNFVSTSNRQLQLDSNHYELIIRQQPKQARLCSSKERDRRPVDPPPIIQLKVNGYGDEAQNFLQSPYYFMCANLVHPTDSGESFTVSSRYLAGTVVSSLHKLKDIDNKDGGFFVFGDISVRVEGRYRLRFSLFEIIRDEVVHIQSVVSDVFTVYSPKAFPGMSESTFLSRSFSDQGRSKSQIAQISTFKSTPPLELLDNTSMSYSQSQHSPYAPSSDSSYPSYQQYHKFRQGGGSLSYPPPLLGYPPHPPQRQNSYYEDHEYGPSSRDDHTSSSPYYYGEQYKQHQPSYVTSSTNNSSSHVFNHDHSLPNARHRSFDVLTLHHNHNKKQLYSSYPPLTPPNLNSSSVDSYKSGNNNSSNNLTPSFTQHFTSSPRPGPLQLPPKSPLSSNMRTNSLPIMSSNSSTSSSNSTTFLNNNEGVLTSSPLLLPTTNTDNLPKLPPITSLTSRIDFIMNKTKDNYYNDSVPQQQGQQYYHQSYSMDDNNLNYNNNVWHNNGGSSIDNGY
ncbi:19850_t:CDS:2 [Rhizophagus irregularis]|nr:19850_t:CDS:2 [Rhizophagus irregularis]